MRMLPLLVVLPLWAAPALAHPPSPPPAHATTQPAASEQATPAARTPAHHHMARWERQFARANSSHDGHLTLEQAIRGYITIARHFKTIDTGNKGYVTIEDVRAWHTRRRAARHRGAVHRGALAHTRPAARPKSSMQRKKPSAQRWAAG